MGAKLPYPTDSVKKSILGRELCSYFKFLQLAKTDCEMWAAVSQTEEIFTSKYLCARAVPSVSMEASS